MPAPRLRKFGPHCMQAYGLNKRPQGGGRRPEHKPKRKLQVRKRRACQLSLA